MNSLHRSSSQFFIQRGVLDATKEFVGNQYAKSNRSKLTRSSLKTISKRYGENLLKKIAEESGRKIPSVSRTQHQSIASLHPASSNKQKQPITAKQIKMLEKKRTSAQIDNPYDPSQKMMVGAGLASQRASISKNSLSNPLLNL